jgi:WD40 repeat protein
VWTLAVAPSGTRFVAGLDNGSLDIYQCYSAAELEVYNAAARRKQDDSAATTPIEKTTKSAAAAWQCVSRIADAHAGATLYSVDYAPARAGHGRIASGGADSSIHIYREVLRLGDGSGSDNKSDHTTSGAVAAPTFVLDAAATNVKGGDINCVCWHPYDGSILASASDDGNVRIWTYKA